MSFPGENEFAWYKQSILKYFNSFLICFINTLYQIKDVSFYFIFPKSFYYE